MKGHLEGFLTLLDMLAEGQRRQADLIAGGGFGPRPRLQPVAALVQEKIPLTRHQISRLLKAHGESKVSIEH